MACGQLAAVCSSLSWHCCQYYSHWKADGLRLWWLESHRCSGGSKNCHVYCPVMLTRWPTDLQAGCEAQKARFCFLNRFGVILVLYKVTWWTHVISQSVPVLSQDLIRIILQRVSSCKRCCKNMTWYCKRCSADMMKSLWNSLADGSHVYFLNKASYH